jgi:hypothetical protein
MRRTVWSVALATALALSAFVPASARDDERRTRGACTGPSNWRLVARHEDASTLRVKFEIEHGAAGQVWELFLSDSGTRFFAGTRTSGTDGHVRVVRFTEDLAGTDRIRGYGYNRATGEVCSGSLRYDL